MDKFPLSEKFTREDKFLNALAEAYRLQEAIIGTTELAIISTNTEGIITSFNKAAEFLLGYTAEEVIGKESPVIFHDPREMLDRALSLSDELNIEVKPGLETFTAKALHSKTADRKEWTYVRKDQHRFPVMLSVTALWDDKGKLIGFAGIATDITEQKKREERLSSSESHLQALLTAVDDIVIEINRKGVYTNIWTKNDEMLFVQPREEYIGKTIYEVLKEPLFTQYKTAIDTVFATRVSQYLEYPVANGRWSSGKISYIDEEKVIVLVRNITHKKEADIALEASEQKYRSLAENLPGVIYLCRNDETYSMLYLNGKVEELTGFPSEDFVSGKLSFVSLYHPDDKDNIVAEVDRALKEKRPFTLEFRLLNRNGEWRWVKEVGMGVYTNDKLTLIEGFISDITIQKRAEDELRKVAEENFRLFNNAITLSVIAAFDGYFKRVNPAWTNLLGWSEDELLRTPILDFVHPDDRKQTAGAIEFLQKGNNLHSFDNRYRCKDGTYRWLLWSSAADIESRVIYASAIDITERKKSEEELIRSKRNLESVALKLQEQNRQLDEFAHIISHNLRSPIGNIKALIGLLDDKSSMDEYRVIFEKLKNVSNNLGETMNELMETIKAKKGGDIERMEIRFKEILDKVVQSLEGELIRLGADVTYDFEQVPRINYAKPYLESIFQNLLSNALKYSAAGRKPRIHFEVRPVGETIELRVSDNGQGIDLERFGDKLFGLHKTFHEHSEARGVGLFLIKTQIEGLGGSIHAESGVDKGTTFIIRF